MEKVRIASNCILDKGIHVYLHLGLIKLINEGITTAPTHITFTS